MSAAELDPLLRALDGHPDAAGVPSPEVAARRERAAVLAGEALGPLLAADGLRTSPLGAGWSSDVDAHMTALPAPAELAERGWIPLGGLLRRLGRPGTDRWAIVEDDEVLSALDLHRSPPPGPVEAVLDRIRRRRSAQLREVLELRALVAAGTTLPVDDDALRVAARSEQQLGGSALAAALVGGAAPPAALPGPPLRSLPGRIVRRLGRRRVVVALSGVDGAGKSTLAAALVEALDRAGVPSTVVWTRPGMRLGPLGAVAGVVKRLLGDRPEPGVRAVAAGVGPAQRSRRGLLGWCWSLSVVLSFITDAWRRQLRASGVVIHDRHRLDALVTLDVLYAGVDLRLQQALVARLLPRAALSVYLDVSAEVAVARKPGDPIGAVAVARQLERYVDRGALIGTSIVLDACAPTQAQVLTVLRHLAVAVAPQASR